MRRARIDGAVAAVAVLVALTVATGLSACGSGSSASGSGKASSGPVIVSAAASLQDAFTTFGQSVQPAPRFSFAGSDELAAQIEQGVKPDVFASANTKLPDQLYAKGLVQKPRVFAGNRLVLAVPGDGKVKSIADAAKPGVTIAIGSASVPIGAYTRQVLGKLGAQGAAILKNVRSEEPDVKGVVGKLTQGAVDAGFVYVTDVEATEGQLHAVDLPGDASPVVAYGIAIVKGAKHPQAAKEFVDGILGAKGQHVLEAAGFAPPPGS